MSRMSPNRVGVLLAVVLTACASVDRSGVDRIPFTDELRDRYALTDQEVRSLQYWVSDDIRLERLTATGSRDVQHGRLIERGGEITDSILIPRGTPGVAVGQGRDWVAVSFEPGSYLYFSSRHDGRHVLANPADSDTRYYLWSQDWTTGPGIVPVGKVPYAASPGSADAHLLVQRDAVYNKRSTQRVQRGREIRRR